MLLTVVFFFFNDTATTEIYTLSLTTLFRSGNRGGDFSSAGMSFVMAIPRRSATCSTSRRDRKSTRLNSSHTVISYAVFCLKKKKLHNRTKTELRHANP